METIDQDDVIWILQVLEASDFDELHLEVGDVKVIAHKKGGTLPPGQRETVPEERSPISPPVEARAEPAGAVVSREAPVEPAAPEEQGLTPIKAPMLGTFYRAPKPGAPPFVEQGRLVEPDDTVCIIEVMKLFNTVKAGVRGRIARILAENGQMVEFEQTLFLVEEDVAGTEASGEPVV